MVQYYTLQEAAAKLHVTADQLKEMAKKNEVRAFQDRGNLRFRAQEIDELARTRGLGSDPELQFGEVTRPSEPKSGGPKTPRSTKHVPAPTDQDFVIPSEEVPLGQDPASAAGASKNTPRNPSTRSPSPKRSSPPSPRPQPGSDSDVRLIGDTSGMEFPIEDSEVKVEKSPSPGPKSPSGRKSKIETAPDSGVRIVPLDESSDSDVKIVPDEPDSKVRLGQTKSKKPSDSDIRLEEVQVDSGRGKREEKGHITEEIDLDAEAQKAAREAEKQQKQKPKPRGSSGQLPTLSPFELSADDVSLEDKADVKPPSKRASRVDAEKKGKTDDTDSSGDFELTSAKDLGSSPLELGSDENTPLKLDDDSDEEVGLGELTGPGSKKSGINLQDPVDSGISLEQGGSDEMEIEERVPPGATPRPSAKVDSSSEFELSLDDSDAEEEEESGSSSEFELTLDEPSSQTEEGTSSEFELSLDPDESSSEEVESGAEQHSDSEFELTIDEGGALEMEDSAALEEEDKDIFETDFEVPALDEESGSEAVALDEEGSDSSDFDLDVDEDVDTEAESGSEVVPLDEDEELAPRKKRGSRTMVAEDEEAPGEFEDLAEETETDELEEEAEAEAEEEEAAAPARRSWGVFAPICATVGTFILFFVCLMSYEMVASMWGYHRSSKISSLLVDPLARKLFDDGSFPKE